MWVPNVELKIPRLLVLLRKAIRPHLAKTGIFRISPNKAVADEMQRQIDSGVLEFTNADPNKLAAMIKRFFQFLPVPLVPKEKYTDAVNALKNRNEDDLQKLVDGLDEHARDTLKFLVELMIETVDEQLKNAVEERLSANSLSAMLGTRLLWTEDVSRQADDAFAVASFLEHVMKIRQQKSGAYYQIEVSRDECVMFSHVDVHASGLLLQSFSLTRKGALINHVTYDRLICTI